MKQDEIYAIPITGYTSQGLGVGRVDGQVVFVQGGIAGETANVKLRKVGRNGVWGTAVDVPEPSPHRVEPGCASFGACGGCAFWHMDYEEELRAKRQRVLDAMNRIGDQHLEELTIHGADAVTGYRNKAQYPVGSRSGKAVAGFFRQKTHQIVPVRRCAIQPEESDAVVAAVVRWMNRYGVSAYDENTGKGLVRHIHLRTAMQTRQLLLCLVINGEQIPHATQLVQQVLETVPEVRSISLSVNKRPGNTVLGQRLIPLYGPLYIEDRLCGFSFRISPASFYQVNAVQAERLYQRAGELAQLTKRDVVLELYCGIGTITLALSRFAGRVIGVELSPSAVQDANANAVRNDVSNVEFHQGDAAQEAARLAAEGIHPNVVVVDPPRKGLEPELIHTIAALAPQRLVYISCDPATLARDVALLANHQYTLQAIEAFDLFPRTGHVETVVLMSKVKP